MAGLWLRFGDNLAKAETKHMALDKVVAPSDALALEGLRVLTLRREQSVERECLRLEAQASPEHHAQWFEKYLVLLRQLIGNLDSSLPSNSHFALDSILGEECMALHMYAALLQEQAYTLGSELAPATAPPPAAGSGSPPGSPSKAEGGGIDAAEQYARVAALYRQAAGVYQHIEEELYPAAAAELPADRPVELWEGCARAMQQQSLALAQGVTALRAEAKGVSPPLVAALHKGAADLYEQAAASMRAIQPAAPELKRALSDRLKRFLAISAALHEAKAYRALASERRSQHELGQAVSCLQSALATLKQALAVCQRDQDWKAALQPELQSLQALHTAWDRERAIVYLQAVPASPPALPDGKVLVSPLPYATPEIGEHCLYF